MSTPTISLPASLVQEIAKTNFGAIYTNPLQSNTIRYVIGLAVTFVGSKVFKTDVGTAQTQDLVELVFVLLMAGAIAYSRWKTTHSILSVEDALKSLTPTFEQAATPALRAQLIAAIKSTNPTLGDIVAKEMTTIPYPASP